MAAGAARASGPDPDFDTRLELHLLDILDKYPPVGVHKHMRLFAISHCIYRRMGVWVSSDDIIAKLGEFFDLSYMEEALEVVEDVLESDGWRNTDFALPADLIQLGDEPDSGAGSSPADRDRGDPRSP